MSPVNEYVDDEVVVSTPDRVKGVIHQVTGTSERMPLRVLILFITIAACTTMSPVPLNIIGVAAVAMLALDQATHRR
jgi:hypothetical protein